MLFHEDVNALLDDQISGLIKHLELNPPVQREVLSSVQEIVGVIFPSEYVECVEMSNGAEGQVGNNSYLVLWRVGDIPALNAGYTVEEFAPGLLIFGSDGGNTAFAFDMRTKAMPIVEVPFIGMNLEEARMIASTFTGFLEYLYNK